MFKPSHFDCPLGGWAIGDTWTLKSASLRVIWFAINILIIENNVLTSEEVRGRISVVSEPDPRCRSKSLCRWEPLCELPLLPDLEPAYELRLIPGKMKFAINMPFGKSKAKNDRKILSIYIMSCHECRNWQTDRLTNILSNSNLGYHMHIYHMELIVVWNEQNGNHSTMPLFKLPCIVSSFWFEAASQSMQTM